MGKTGSVGEVTDLQLEDDVMKWFALDRQNINEIIKEFLEVILPKHLRTCAYRFKNTEESLVQDFELSLLQPLRDFILREAKRVRPLLMNLSYRSVGASGELGHLILIPELIHNGTLIIDDIEDCSLLRRGKPALHTLVGTDVALNAGNYLYFCYHHLLKDCTLSCREGILRLVTEEMAHLHIGQSLDILWHQGAQGKDVPTETEYILMCKLKTGTLMRLAAKLGALLGGGTQQQIDAIGTYAETLGIAFQIKDDILNVQPTLEWGKEKGEDIREGKMSLLVVRTAEVASSQDRKTLLRILTSHTDDYRQIHQAISLFEKYDSFDYAERVARLMVKDACKTLIDTLPSTKAREKLLQLAKFTVLRKR